MTSYFAIVDSVNAVQIISNDGREISSFTLAQNLSITSSHLSLSDTTLHSIEKLNGSSTANQT